MTGPMKQTVDAIMKLAQEWKWSTRDVRTRRHELEAAIESALSKAREDAQTEQQTALSGKYGNVLVPFVAFMDAELHANASKGDRPGWLSMSPDVALLEIYWHTAKLSAAVKNRDAARIREHSADVANMAMMLLDVCGGLTSVERAATDGADWTLQTR